MSSAEDPAVDVANLRPGQGSLKDEIVRVAVELGTELGEDGLTMRGIASRLGVSATALYQHFEGKSSILRAIRVHGMRVLAQELAPAFEGKEAVESIRDCSKRYIAFARKNSWMYCLLFHGERIDPESISPEDAEGLENSHVKLREAFQALADGGQLREGVDPSVATWMLWSSNHGIACLMISGRISAGQPGFPPGSDDEFVDGYVEHTVRGFLRA